MDKETHDQFGLLLEALRSQQVINKGLAAQLELAQKRIDALDKMLITTSDALLALAKGVK